MDRKREKRGMQCYVKKEVNSLIDVESAETTGERCRHLSWRTPLNSSLCTFIGMKHISPTFMYIIPMYLRLTTFTKTLPQMSFHLYFFAIFISLWGSTHDSADCWSAHRSSAARDSFKRVHDWCKAGWRRPGAPPPKQKSWLRWCALCISGGTVMVEWERGDDIVYWNFIAFFVRLVIQRILQNLILNFICHVAAHSWSLNISFWSNLASFGQLIS